MSKDAQRKDGVIPTLQSQEHTVWRLTAKRVKDAKKPKFSSRKHNRCKIADVRGLICASSDMCRLCFRQLGAAGRDSRSFEVVLVVRCWPLAVEFSQRASDQAATECEERRN